MARKARTPKAGDVVEIVVSEGGTTGGGTSGDGFNGADPAAFDHDNDGKPGGSKKRTIGSAERDAICREAFEAYDFQDERVRFDTLGRRWLFRVDKVNSNSVLTLEVSRLDAKASDTIPTPFLASDLAMPMIADVIDALVERLG